ncbi:MAG TPA: TonB-dependent receptor, partial [Terriglobales bacterium]|nr:TonB-dependent receptor [Terriglobales bacterium]
LDAVWAATPRHEISCGVVARRRDTRIAGTFPADSTDFAPDAPTREYDTHPVLVSPGLYLEDKLRLVGPLYATVGGRLDGFSTAGGSSADPRAALAWRVDEHQTVRLAAGRYHQAAEARYLDPRYGNPRLAPLEADHVIAGYEWKSEFGNVRLEAYHKTYRHLVTVDPRTWYASDGTGFARGVDAFVQGTYRWLSGWVSYGWLDTRRRELDDPRPLATPYGVEHSVTLVGLYQASARLHLGVRYGYGSGQPYTPVVGRRWDAVRGLWFPVFGENYSARIPPYHRLDLRVTRLLEPPHVLGLRPSSTCAAYLEGLNVLGIRNVLEYDWNADYTQRVSRESYFARRMLVAGFALTW